MNKKVNLDDLNVGDTIKLVDGTVGVVLEIEPVPEDDREFLLFDHRYTVTFRIEDGTLDSWLYRDDGTGDSLCGGEIVAIIPKIDDDKLSHEEVIENLVIEADALEKDLEERDVMIDALVMERDELKKELKIAHIAGSIVMGLFEEQLEINKAKQDELDFQSEQLAELLGDEFMFDDEFYATIEFISIDDLEGTEDELYDPFNFDD